MGAGLNDARVISTERAKTLLEPLTELVLRAGAAILAIVRGADLVHKADGSPVTAADLAADRVIADGLAQLCPGIPVLSEECSAAGRPTAGSVFVIDPLDGTKEYVAGRDEFTVNLALVTNGEPVLGLVGAPALGRLWRGVAGHGAERLVVGAAGDRFRAEAIRTRPMPRPPAPVIIATSRSHLDDRTIAFTRRFADAQCVSIGSALKFCRVAEGEADIYPRLAPICEWDIAAGAALLVAAGGKVIGSDGGPLRFDAPRENFIVPEFIAWGDRDARLNPTA
jgi:3'(2'), 5'-bisphosphate nucleotidase